MSGHYPNLQLRNIQPNVQVVKIDGASEASVNVDKANIKTTFPTSGLDNFKTLAGVFFPIVISKLEIEALNRIGFRMLFEKRFDSKAKMAIYARDMATGTPRQQKYMNIDGNIVDFERSIRWESESKGCFASLKTLQLKLDIDTPPEFDDVTPIHAEKNSVLVDVDFYAHLPTPIGKFNGPTLIEDWYHLIRRDISEFLHA
jgi:hypothetical protein